MTYEFSDEWGSHSHTTQFGPPYETNAKLSCVSCIDRVVLRTEAQRKKLSVKHSLPPKFWDSFPISL